MGTGYEETEEDCNRVLSWQYCPHCLAKDGEAMPPNPSGVEGNRFAHYMGKNRYKCSWCGQIFEREPIGGSLCHVLNLPDAPHTMLDNSAVKDPAYGEALFERHIGIDGEEVVVIVFKKP